MPHERVVASCLRGWVAASARRSASAGTLRPLSTTSSTAATSADASTEGGASGARRPASAGPLPLAVAAYSVWGANTNVGKTLVSVGLAYAAAGLQVPLSYIKPVQTGFPADSDARLVALASGGSVSMGQHAAVAAEGRAAVAVPEASAGAAGPRCSTLFAWQHAVSPHLAARLEGRAVPDEQLVAEAGAAMQREAAALAAAGDGGGASGGVLLVETAGGVTSPAPSGSLACNALRPLRLPAILVGDPRLGGIAATLSALDSLQGRGWSVEAVVVLGAGEQTVPSASASAAAARVPLDNLDFLRSHLGSEGAAAARLGAPAPEVVGLPACAPPPPGHDPALHGLDPCLAAWLTAARPHLQALLTALRQRHAARTARLLAAAREAEGAFWWPFTQHAGLTPGSATVVDSRCGDTWTALSAPASTAAAGDVTNAQLVPLYDASCSWWTQAATSALQPHLAAAVGGAAGRYMHVLFPEIAHEPALAAARRLLGPGGPGQGWASRVFFSDDGSTAIEVALKMAFRKFLSDRGELEAFGAGGGGGGGGGGELQVLGLQGAYHGDTLGSQDCVPPSVFNGPLQAPWYRGRGLFLEPPYVGMRQGAWRILDPPAWLSRHHPGPLPAWPSLDAMLDPPTASTASTASLTAAYRSYIEAAVAEYEAAQGAAAGGSGAAAGACGGRLAACILEPLVQGAGGMAVVEPGFQRAMAQFCRERRLPLIADEVFTGLLRAGHVSASAALGVVPDIACFAKLLTGGAVPGAVTLASEDVFRAFAGPSKLFSLLHGHSYTAFPIGCAAASASLQLLTSPETNPNVCHPCRCPKTPACDQPCGRLLPLYDDAAVRDLSYHPLLSRVVSIGTVLAVELAAAAPPPPAVGGLGAAAASAARYGSVGAVQLVRRLRDQYGIYARPLGQVVYVMVPPTAPRSTAAWLLQSLRAALDACAGQAGAGGDRMGAAEESEVV
ncbi:hypothetical protein HYH03_000445 [Edaphochlamys debaryana]|uniref:Uncharacterized protein n=1 Tax=Edaphochlamys debaryana TaxID=47281 RepID=A0A835YFH6_9CHLO|nr:hypothetical protein HYH03_000445 [Edaphochlamys debaryana]|eukprot:KAG2501947.1 hypothetical protein HYH03_000445 [Edaphochlamys debaryana]